MELAQRAGKLLLAEARRAVEFGLETGTERSISLRDYPAELRVERATFVTLRAFDDLLGCVGTMRAHRPLVLDVVHNAFSAALHDPRFGPMSGLLLRDLDIHISILSPLEEIHFDSEEDLLRRLDPGVDGLLLEAGDQHATFLPVMWKELPQPSDFVRHLKRKAGMPGEGLPEGVRAFRYTTSSVA